MGACCSWCKENDPIDPVVQERTPLLADSTTINTIIQKVPENYTKNASVPKASIEKGGLERIVAEVNATCMNIGDIRNSIDKQELMERQDQYTNKLLNLPMSAVANTAVNLRLPAACLLKDVPGPEKILSKTLDLPYHYHEIMSHVNEAQRMLSKMSVEHKGELISVFN